MEINVNRKHYEDQPATSQLISLLEQSQSELELVDSQLYYKFPLYKDSEGGIVESRVMVISPNHNVVVFWTIEDASVNPTGAIADATEHLDQVYSSIYARLIRNRNLRRGRELSVSIEVAIYAPFIKALPGTTDDTKVITRDDDLKKFMISQRVEPAEPNEFAERVSTLEGSKGLIRPKKRDIANLKRGSKGAKAAKLEAEIARFDKQQKNAYTGVLDGLQRIRGLAGSGKTVLLAMKAALTHLRNPEETIAFTFYTKSLYQHVQRLITRFYREFDDKDPDWDKLRILHAWGGSTAPGVYSLACRAHNVAPMSFGQASVAALLANPFGFACDDLQKRATIKPLFDYIFIDEGQDFPVSFVRLCRSLAKEERVLWAYDELQTLFQASTPTASDVYGVNKADGLPAGDFSEDTTLYKCYRNPREVLVSAHALGFGIYGKKIVQMLENKDHWEDIGYKVVSGEMTEGSQIVIERPQENSPLSLSQEATFDELVRVLDYKDLDDEVKGIADSIAGDLKDGLRPDDILVIVTDDRVAKTYMLAIAQQLAKHKVKCNDVHSDSYSVRDFFIEDHVTLSTVYKAKGNEAFMVYIAGVDSLFFSPDVRTRNMAFTAMTRAKGWVRLSGVGDGAKICAAEIKKAKTNFPNLVFNYPNAHALRVMKRDLQRAAIEKQQLDRLFDELLSKMSPEEASAYIQQRADKSRRSRKQPKGYKSSE